jgi:hypothetical protein
MRLPNCDNVLVEREKIVGYLLNLFHRYGASKARFFMQFGFQADTWEIFARALREHPKKHEVCRIRQTPFGPRYEVEGKLNTPDGRYPLIRTVWQLDQGQIAPRLITAYPFKAK